MKFRTLGSSGLVVSPVCLGTMTFGNPVKEEDSIKLVHQVMDLGINFIDTANTYEGYDRILGSSGGIAEEILGKALKDCRDKVVLATKIGSPLGDGPQDVGLTATLIGRDIDSCLRRLQTNYLDLLYFHWPDSETPLETSLAAMETAVRQGKVRYFAVSNFWAHDICEMLWLADKGVGPRVACSQIPYSLLKRDYHNDLDFCRRHNIAVTPYRVLEGGALSGKYRRGVTPPKNSRALEKPQWMPEMDEKLFDIIEATQALADQAGVHISQYTLAWTLAQPAITSLVLGAKRIEQIKDAVIASDIQLSSEILERQDAIAPPPWSNHAPFKRT